MADKRVTPDLLDDKQAPEPTELAPPNDSGLAAVIERVAMTPGVDVVKLEKIIELQERILKHNARAAFNAAFAGMQADLPEIDEKGVMKDRAGTVRYKYARLEDIQTAIKPILRKHGFALRHRTEWPEDKPGIIRVVGILSHIGGHSEESVFEALADKSEYRSDIQSMGSTISYSRRYSTIDLLNITTRGLDNDGQKAGVSAKPPVPEPVDGMTFEDWWKAVSESATRGVAAFDPAWECSDHTFKNYALRHDRDGVNALKATARAAGKGKP